MKDKQTPLMKQYNQIKEKYPDTILLYRLGDFFETFEDDAVITAKVCGITLTKRNHGAAGDMPLAGFPHHQLDAYLPKLVRAGYRVAVCEQIEDPKLARGIVKRDVVEVVTPGVALYDKLLDNKRNNYVAALFLLNQKNSPLVYGIACADISTGEFFTGEIAPDRIKETLETLAPAEIIISKAQKTDFIPLAETLSFKPLITKLEEWIFEISFGKDILFNHFKTKNFKGFGIEDLNSGIVAAGAVLHYISETQSGKIGHLNSLRLFLPTDFMTLDYATRRNLEIVYTMEGTSEGALISILDETVTAMGGRLFKNWISRPLRDLNQINKRLNAVEALFINDDKRHQLRTFMESIGDLERLISKISSGRANPRDCSAMNSSMKMIPAVKSILSEIDNEDLNVLSNKLDPVHELTDYLDNSLADEPAVSAGNGNIFKRGFSSELDTYIEAKHSGKKWIAEYQEREREASGINSLKVSFNNVFGYYIEITNVNSAKTPAHYDRKQTLSNAERYTTPELKEIEEKILNAEEKIMSLELMLFSELKSYISRYTVQIQTNARLVSSLDCLQSFAQASREFEYVKPEIDESDVLEIEDGRHPVVERLLPVGDKFSPNSTLLSSSGEQIHIITGPNMSGKSCYLRQTALIVLLGQVGCFVPAKKAHFGIIDRIFTRVGAQDNISAGESTFLVEMQESANILNNASESSLILLDEVGRGTATFDGISIAWSIAEFIHDRTGAKTLFATHYHELNDLAERYDRIENYKVEVIETGNTVIFSHKVVKGASDHSFGIHVARMAGMPYDVIERANEIMSGFEGKTDENDNSKSKPDTSKIASKKKKATEGQLAIFEFKDDELRSRLLELKIDNMTPVQALQVLAEMQRHAKKG